MKCCHLLLDIDGTRKHVSASCPLSPLVFSLAGKGGCQSVPWVLDSGGQVWRSWALCPGQGWQERKPLSPAPHTRRVCGKPWCSSAPEMGCFNWLMWHFRCVLLLSMALVNWVRSVKSPMHTRASIREEEEEMGLQVLVALVYWVGSAIFLKNTNRLCWDFTATGRLHRHYTLRYGFTTAIIVAFGHSGSLGIFNPFSLSNYSLFLQTFAKGLGEDTIGKCELMQLCKAHWCGALAGCKIHCVWQ